MMQRFFSLQIRDFKIAKSEADISYYAGYVGKIIFIISYFWSLYYKMFRFADDGW